MTDLAVAPLGFPAAARLRRSVEFQRLRRSGKKIDTTHFILYFQVSAGATARLGLTVSRKVGNAVVRNRVKRRVREFFRTRRPSLLYVLDLSVVVRPTAALLGQRQIEEELTMALQRLSFLGKL